MPPHCPHCRYDLEGTPMAASMTCPECRETWTPALLGKRPAHPLWRWVPPHPDVWLVTLCLGWAALRRRDPA